MTIYVVCFAHGWTEKNLLSAVGVLIILANTNQCFLILLSSGEDICYYVLFRWARRGDSRQVPVSAKPALSTYQTWPSHSLGDDCKSQDNIVDLAALRSAQCCVEQE